MSQVHQVMQHCRKTFTALSFDDITLRDQYSTVGPESVSVATHVTKTIKLKTPIMSAAMDTVTEAGLALALAKAGGIGIIHRNLSAAEQAQQVDWVRKQVHHRGMVSKPVTFLVTDTVSTIETAVQIYGYSFTSFPIVDKDGKLCGLISRDQMDFVRAGENPMLCTVMNKTPMSISEHSTLDDAENLMYTHNVKKLPIVDSSNTLKGMYVWKDLFEDRSMYSLDKEGHFLVGAAVGVLTPQEKERVDMLVKVGCKVIVIDCSHGACDAALDMLRYIKTTDCQAIVGNVASAEACSKLVRGGILPDAIKVGIGPGSICTTRQVTGHGVPQVTAVHEVWTVANSLNIPIIVDGGIRCSGDMVKAFAVGANAVMLGSMLAAATESPGDVIQGKYKKIRGMGSREAMSEREGSRKRYFKDMGSALLTQKQSQKLTPEGVVGMVEHRGSVRSIVDEICGGIKAGLAHSGACNILEFQKKVEMWIQTPAGVIEGRPHSINQ